MEQYIFIIMILVSLVLIYVYYTSTNTSNASNFINNAGILNIHRSTPVSYNPNEGTYNSKWGSGEGWGLGVYNPYHQYGTYLYGINVYNPTIYPLELFPDGYPPEPSKLTKEQWTYLYTSGKINLDN